MRCIGAENPPCVRCSKTGRNCVVHASRRGQHQSANSLRKWQPPVSSSPSDALHQQDSQNTTDAATSSVRRSPPVHTATPPAFALQSPSYKGGRVSPASTSQPDQNVSPSLPSVYSLSPLAALDSVALQQPLPESWSQPASDGIAVVPSASSRRNPKDVPDTVLVELIEFFREKISYFVPVIDDADLKDPLYVVKHRRPLAYCASFVASQFIPGSASVREQLTWPISDFIRATSGPLAKNESIVWTQLQAFAILYAYRPAADVFHLASAPQSGFLDHWVLKYSIEAFALRAGLHRSIDSLKVLLQQNPPDISKSPAFQRYVYWLWLVTMSHHFSLMTRTPPTIREDSTISSAVDLLRDVPKPTRVTRILAEVDLYMLWQQAGRSAPGLAEWWCKPSGTMNMEEVVAVLEDMEGALEVWGQRWGLRGESNMTISNVDVSRNGAVDFHFQSTRFCISTFGTRYMLEKARSALDAHTASRQALAPVAREFVVKSVEAAHACSRCLMDTPPLRRENIRYMADFGYALIAFCCLYIIQACELFSSTLPNPTKYLDSVEEVATFMGEMAVANNTAPRFYGNSILQQLKRIPKNTGNSGFDSQLWTEQHEGAPTSRATVSQSPVALISEGYQVRMATFDELPEADGPEGFARPSPQLSTSSFPIFDPSWGALLR
ncbi:uncharacterized protein Z520_04052 [Fonsecaea multimorphosa CBS 102226]|uniref:Transcription factor domain-containing protein n=1 Tax=Fonsecaea multimorphosa CBS 102226 TaxID=1442371 RepID=A0A0D2ITS8_9EURO|nr:uncharacterized protein Z520_04052 [Fonsecaea multimorphosa CBS 102226]KIY00367.1 hypothetical protein Z520_04052 [Fonsecaea multimorphosa CBS 102226]